MFEGPKYDRYIEKWKLHEVVNSAVTDVLVKLPHNPYELLRDRFAALCSGLVCDVSPHASGQPRDDAPQINTPTAMSTPLFATAPVHWEIEAKPRDTDELLDSLSFNDGSLHGARRFMSCGALESKEHIAPLRQDTLLPQTTVTSLRASRSFFKPGSNAGIPSPKSGIIKRTSLSAAERLGPKFLEKLLHISLELCSNVTRSDVLLPFIIESSKELLHADRCSLFVLEDDFLVTQINPEEIIRVHKSTGLVGHCATSCEPINLADAYSDHRFNRTVDDMTGYRTKSLLCCPITCDGEVVAVAQLLNKTVGKVGGSFTDDDLNLFKTYAAFAGLAIHNAKLYNEKENLMQKNRFFITVLESLSQGDMRKWSKVVEDVARGAAAVLNAEFCTLFVVDKETNELFSPTEKGEIRFSAWKGVAGHCYTTGETVNLTDPYNDARYNPEIDKETGLVTHSLLTLPVRHMSQVIAVAQVINKKEPGGFTSEDEDTLKYFAQFGGVALSNAKLYDFVLESRNKAMALFEKQFDCMSLPGETASSDPGSVIRRKAHLRKWFVVHPSEIDACVNFTICETQLDSAMSSTFDINRYREPHHQDALVAIVCALFEKLDLFAKFHIPKKKFVTFLCAVRAKYRSVPYHNFVHAVDVTQTLFTYLHEGGCRELLSDLDMLSLMVSGLVHDIDHMGLNNSFHFKTESPLGILSSASGATSVLEVHHCHVALQLLEVEDFDIFADIQRLEFAEVNHAIVSNILATDMAKHGEILQRARCTFFSGYNKESKEHRKLLCNFLIKAADISNVTKPFDLSRQWGVLVTEEFLFQGDAEKVFEVPAVDNKKLANLARGQIDFINSSAVQLYETLATAFPKLSWPLAELNANVARWNSLLAS